MVPTVAEARPSPVPKTKANARSDRLTYVQSGVQSVDLLHVYSKQSGGTPPAWSLVDKARESKRRTGGAAAVKRARQLRPGEIEALVEHYRESGSVGTAAKAVGITRQTAGKYLSDAGFATVRRMSDDDIARAREAHEAGKSVHSISHIIGFSPHTVAKALK